MKVLLSGGGTLGPVVPLLAIAEQYKQAHPEAVFVYVGTKSGPEKELVEKYGLPYFAISSGKLRRYFSWLNFLDIFKIIIAFFESLVLLWQEKPALVISAGGFVSVPVHFAAFCLGIPSWVHQQDYLPGLANRLMSPMAKKITTALQISVRHYSKKKTEWIGNPTRDLSVNNLEASYNCFRIPPGAPVIFALGGGTGSAKVNKIILEALPSWPQSWHVVHLAGKERPHELQDRASGVFANYHVFDFFTDEMADAYAIASVVIARAGFATITELASLQKPAIIIPKAKTHQEDNAKFLWENKAVVVMDEENDNGLKLAQVVKRLLGSADERRALGMRLHTLLPPARQEKVVEIIDEMIT